jgi:dTDP-4-dehydrorhamnose reductase
MVIGGTGLLGKALSHEWTEEEVVAFGSKDVDIRSLAQVESAVRDNRPDWIVLAAAYTDVDGCETNRELAFEVNTQGALTVARTAAINGSRLLFLSSDYVFDGHKATPYETSDPLSPQCVYGESKARAEIGIREVLSECCIVRTSWVFGVGGKCFPDTILKLAEKQGQLDVVADQRACPTYTIDLARAIIELCRKNAAGTIHATNQDACSWFDFATEIIRESGLNTRVLPTTSDKFVRPAKRPAYSVLSNASLHRFGVTMPTWQDALKRYLAERRIA